MRGCGAAAGPGPGGPLQPSALGCFSAVIWLILLADICRLSYGWLSEAEAELAFQPRIKGSSLLNPAESQGGCGDSGVCVRISPIISSSPLPRPRGVAWLSAHGRPTVRPPEGLSKGPIFGSGQCGEHGRMGTPGGRTSTLFLLPGLLPTPVALHRLPLWAFPSLPPGSVPDPSTCPQVPLWNSSSLGQGCGPHQVAATSPGSQEGLGVCGLRRVLRANAPVWEPVCLQLGRQKRLPGGPRAQLMFSVPPWGEPLASSPEPPCSEGPPPIVDADFPMGTGEAETGPPVRRGTWDHPSLVSGPL